MYLLQVRRALEERIFTTCKRAEKGVGRSSRSYVRNQFRLKGTGADPLVPIGLWNETVDFLIDTGGAHSVVTSYKRLLSKCWYNKEGILQAVFATNGIYSWECEILLLGQVLLLS